MKRMLVLALAALILISSAACSPSSKENQTNAQATSVITTSTAEPAEEAKVSFPLKETLTIKAMYSDLGGCKPEDNKWIEQYQKETNVKIEWIKVENAEKFNILMTSGGYGDVMMGSIPNVDMIPKLSASGTLIPLNEYFNEDITPNIMNIFEANKKLKGILTSPDGKIYTLFRFTDLPQNYLESPFWINKGWLANVGKAVPTTLDELTDVLRAFKTGDPNKNGKADEIPLLTYSADAYSHFEALLGMYGIPTKDNALDNYVMVKDGKVLFVPTLPAYKEAIKYFSSLYKEGLIWNEAFTATAETFTSKLNSETASFGLINIKNVPQNVDQYECMLPPKVPGYEPCWYYHPGSLGAKNVFAVFDKCSDVKTVMAFIDGFYNFDNSVKIMYGMPGEGIIEQKDGMYKFVTPPEGKSQSQLINELSAYMSFSPPSAILRDKFGTSVELSETLSQLLVAYNMYEPFINKEVWPRPYFSTEATSKANELRTDIFNTVTKYKAMWISGQSNVDADWEKFNNELKSMGLDEYISILQSSYDIYNNAIGK